MDAFRSGLILLAALGAGIWLGAGHSEPTYLDFLSVGQGDCAVFSTAGRTILIDDGPADEYQDAGERIVAPRLRALGVESVDAILLSHPDADHVGGTGAVLRDYPEAKIVMSDQFRDDPLMLAHLAAWHVKPDSVVWLPERATLRLGDFTARLACPRIHPREEANDGSMFVHLTGEGASATFSGDAPQQTEIQEEANGPWNADVLKVGHHGSRTASGESWLEEVRPTYAIVSVGLRNRYGHPNKEVLDRLVQDHIQTFRTDQDGDLKFEVRDGHFVPVPRS